MSNLGSNFYPKLVQISNELGMNPEDLLLVMTSESGINPSSFESKYHGAGLLGFMPDTLKGLGFKGTWQDFINMSGADQLDYVKKLVHNNMSVNNGKPFTSAAQYYVANLWPIALKLPGIQQGNPNTAFIEEHPATITDPKSGKEYSKKYYNLGYFISPSFESAAYKANPLFHGSTQGAITYGDMMKQVEKNKQNSIYQKALATMHSQTGYSPHPENQTAQPTAENNAMNSLTQIDNLLSRFLSALSAHQHSNDLILKKSYKEYLPEHQFLIRLDANETCDALEFARILTTAMKEELLAESTIFHQNGKIEVECSIHGNQYLCAEAVIQLCGAMSDVFEMATHRLGGIKIATHIMPNVGSNYQELDIKLAEVGYQAFHHKIASIHVN